MEQKRSLVLSAALVIVGMTAAAVFASSMSIETAPRKYGVHELFGEVHPTMLNINAEAYHVYPPPKGVRIIGCKIERPAKFGFNVIWGGKPVQNFNTCNEIMGKEFKGSGHFMVAPIDRTANTGRVTVKVEDIM